MFPVRGGGRSSAAVYTRCGMASLTAWIMSFLLGAVWLANCMVNACESAGFEGREKDLCIQSLGGQQSLSSRW
jgi:hypothetical protein